MRRDLAAPLPEPRWPDGITPALFTAPDAAMAHALMQLAYADGGGSVPRSFEQWWENTSGDPEFDRTLCFLARAGDDTLVGFALCWTSSFVKDLVVHPDWRRHGIGEALLLAALQELKARGHHQAALKVEAANPSGAERLYRRLGFVAA